jgi:colicin import membrane protein
MAPAKRSTRASAKTTKASPAAKSESTKVAEAKERAAAVIAAQRAKKAEADAEKKAMDVAEQKSAAAAEKRVKAAAVAAEKKAKAAAAAAEKKAKAAAGAKRAREVSRSPTPVKKVRPTSRGRAKVETPPVSDSESEEEEQNAVLTPQPKSRVRGGTTKVVRSPVPVASPRTPEEVAKARAQAVITKQRNAKAAAAAEEAEQLRQDRLPFQRKQERNSQAANAEGAAIAVKKHHLFGGKSGEMFLQVAPLIVLSTGILFAKTLYTNSQWK